MIRGVWTRETVALLLIAAWMPLVLFWLWFGGGEALGRLGLVALILAFWHLLFLLARAQPVSLAALLTALAIAMLAPEGLGAFRLALGVSFGAVMGELVFGGWGRNVVNPATVALSFLGFGFPGLPWPEVLAPVTWAALPVAALGIGFGVMPAGVILGASLTAAALAALDLGDPAFLPAAAVVLVLLVADPVVSAVTPLGRWLNGAVFGGLVTLFADGWAGAAPVQTAVAAALLASLAAPLLDEIALALWHGNRRRRHGRA